MIYLEEKKHAYNLLMLQRDNVLILDEPTNHLDIDSKEMLEQALQNFEGTIIFVSHDRYFINQLANKVFDLNHDGGKIYLGNYQYYIEKPKNKHLKAHENIQRADNKLEKTMLTTIIIQIILIKRTQTSAT